MPSLLRCYTFYICIRLIDTAKPVPERMIQQACSGKIDTASLSGFIDTVRPA